MINLIPIKEKEDLRNDFYFRFLTMVFSMLCFSVFVLLVVILPSYLISLESRISNGQALEKQKNEIMPEIDQQALVSIKDLNDKLNLLEEARNNKYVFSEKVINEIILKKVPGIKINKFFYQNDSLEGRKVNITGIAENREQLLLFRMTLENDKFFEKVDLPISNFVKGNNIEFSLNLISV
jgi:Tfp pilus assembly protein PilN